MTAETTAFLGLLCRSVRLAVKRGFQPRPATQSGVCSGDACNSVFAGLCFGLGCSYLISTHHLLSNYLQRALVCGVRSQFL
jgi:hypothetical protein